MSVALPPKPLSTEAVSRRGEADAALRAADPTAFPIAPRALKRVIIQDLGLTGLGLNVPHRKSWLLSGGRVQQLLEPDELGLADFVELPAQLILLARAEDDELERMSLLDLKQRYWRLLFHARIHRELDDALADGRLTDALVREHIERLGQVAFDEIADVLRREKFLTPDDTRTMVFVEFAAVFLELLYFSPDWLVSYFPSLSGSADVESLLTSYVPADALFEATRPVGVGESQSPRQPDDEDAPPAWWTIDERQTRGAGAYQRLTARARRSSARGNNARAARWYLQASQHAPEVLSGDAILAARREVQSLTTRLQVALGFGDDEVAEWLESLTALLAAAKPGFWNPDARLLYDLQKVALDHERDVFVVDAWTWLRSLGRRPLRRKLPYQREVLMCRHLRSAVRRLTTSRLVGAQRDRWLDLLRRATDAAEAQLRKHLRPPLEESIEQVGLSPQDVPDRVARNKVIEEWLDVIVERGFLTLGYLRDALSRNQLKFRDLADRDLITGGPLLRLDRQCADRLDGVYQPGEFYLRWLQRLSGAVFGTRYGRLVTLFLILPFGGAYLVLEGLDHLWNAIARLTNLVPEFHLISKSHAEDASQALSRSASGLLLVGLGLFFLGLIHSPPLRQGITRFLSTFFAVLKGVLFEFPAKVMRQPAMRAFLRSQPIVMFRRQLLFPLIVTGLLWPLIPTNSLTQQYHWPIIGGLFVAALLALNSRLGRTVEAATAEWFEFTWYTVRVRIVVALFEGVMDFFKRVTEWIERLLYAVDEWLRFKSGESETMLALKASMGLVWAVVAYAIRFCVNLLIEPQINPIKHFPVVTVSHKIILPTQPLLARVLIPTLGTAWGQAVAGAIIFGTPGMFGFLVWELKENWRLYAANRSPTLRPAPIGTHGETVTRLMRPGFHSGSLPKLYAKFRKARRRPDPSGRRAALARCDEQLHHLERAFRNFAHRELVELLTRACEFDDGELRVGHVQMAVNSIRWELDWRRRADEPLRCTLAEQSGYLVAGLDSLGWFNQIDRVRRLCCDRALSGFYALCGVDLVREHLASALHSRFWSYDIADSGLVVWPERSFETEIIYPFTDSRTFAPRPHRVAERFQLPRLEADDIFFSRHGIRWSDWVAAWSPQAIAQTGDGDAEAIPQVLPRAT